MVQATDDHKLTPSQVANGYRRVATDIETKAREWATEIRLLANEIALPDDDGFSRASHHSG
jgi:hypothetical protein